MIKPAANPRSERHKRRADGLSPRGSEAAGGKGRTCEQPTCCVMKTANVRARVRVCTMAAELVQSAADGEPSFAAADLHGAPGRFPLKRWSLVPLGHLPLLLSRSSPSYPGAEAPSAAHSSLIFNSPADPSEPLILNSC